MAIYTNTFIKVLNIRITDSLLFIVLCIAVCTTVQLHNIIFTFHIQFDISTPYKQSLNCS